MSLAREALGVMLWMTFGGLALFGAGLLIAAAGIVLDRNASTSADSTRIRAGRRSQLRRYATCWIIIAVLWTTIVLVLASLRGT